LKIDAAGNNKVITFRDPKKNLAQHKDIFIDDTGAKIMYGIIRGNTWIDKGLSYKLAGPGQSDTEDDYMTTE